MVGDQVFDRLLKFFNKRLFHQAYFRIKFIHPAFHDLIGDFFRFPFGQGLAAQYRAFMFQNIGGDFFAGDILGIGSGDLLLKWWLRYFLCHSRSNRESSFWIPAYAGMTKRTQPPQVLDAVAP